MPDQTTVVPDESDHEALVIDAGPEGETLLEIDHVTLRFGGVVALNDVNFSIKRGEILGLAGEEDGIKVTVTGGMNRPPMAETPGILALYERARAVAAPLGIEMPKQHRGGASDGNFTAALGVPTLDGLGCPGAGAHASHEHILWRHLAPRAALMAGLLETLGD